MSEGDMELEQWLVYGNDLLFLDALTAPAPAEDVLSELAQRHLAITGSDSLILLQSCSRKNLEIINDYWSYWDDLPSATPEVLVRIFESDGSESLSCGNGLLSAASLLLERGVPLPAQILTGVSAAHPWTVEVGTDRVGRSWVKNSPACRVPSSLVEMSLREPVFSALDRVCGIAPADAQGMIFPDDLVGYLVLTGEPHMVLFANQWKNAIPQTDEGIGQWLNILGRHLNLVDRKNFPKGINIDLVFEGATGDGLRYRCFERGVNRETGACGTGALAVAYAWRQLSCENCEMIKVRPYGADNGGYNIRWGEGGMRLCGLPRFAGRVPVQR